ncbi:ABC transporter substrate-binding protein [Collinsella sp. AGMB00827]|uniref:ABC transporter substrate-binding protein n=1 Tax=Collinsella ureilytica TaxID=2869515 RepID=A0ABS7MI36_9ACTN|nr:ABC transporter substrate-binding protein [Collinsella urealyticum]MBY4797037.1 ABC transporter substrate-binding protein [Collinsella urealyticum]
MAETKISRRSFVGGSLAAGTLALLAACGKKGAPAAGGGSAAASGGTLNYYINNPKCIDPYNVQEDQGTQVEYQMFDALTTYDYNENKLVGLAAEKWEANDTATEFTFHLVAGAKFHNGEPVTAEDFKRSFVRLVNPKSAVATAYAPSEISYHLAMVEGYEALSKGETDDFSGVEAVDEHTLKVKLASAYADFPYVCSHPALAPVPAAAEKDAKNFYLAPIGNGPFKIDGQWEDGQQINLVRFDDYYGEKAKIDGIHFAIIKDVETAYKEFQAGNLDVCDVPTAQITAAKEDRGESKDGYTMSEGQHMVLGAEPSTYYLVCNTAKEPFNNADLRKGISYAINRAAICETLFKGSRTPADGIIPPGIDGYRKGAWKHATYDVDKANEYLNKVAPMNGSSRGITVTLSYNQDGGHKEIMESVIGDLDKVGITVKSDTPEWSALLSQYQAGNFEFGRLGWIADYPIMDNFLFPLFHSASIGGDNKSNYSNPEVDKLIDEARTVIDPKKRIETMHKADDLIAEDFPVIPLMFYSHKLVGSDRVKHLYIDPQKLCDMAGAEMSA